LRRDATVTNQTPT